MVEGVRGGAGHAAAGSITILALWGVAIVGVLVAALTATIRTELRSTENAVAESRARLAADAGVQLGLARLLRRRTDGVLVFDGAPEWWRDGSTEVEIAIFDEAGKIDLNEAPLELLSGLLAAVGRPREEAMLLACNILDWRGNPRAPCPEPTEAAFPRSKLTQRFVAPEQLAQVPGFDERLYELMADHVTVATRASAVDPLTAGRPVLLAIPGATPMQVDTFLASRARWHGVAAVDTGLGLAGALPFVTTSPAREFTISATAITAARARHRADLLVRMTEIAARPYEVLSARAPPADRWRVSPAARRMP